MLLIFSPLLAAAPAAPAAAVVWPFARRKPKPPRKTYYQFNPARLPFKDLRKI
jgi:hypothetical protein